MVLPQNEVGLLRIAHEGKDLREVEIGDVHEAGGTAVALDQLVGLAIAHFGVCETIFLVNGNDKALGTLETDCLGVLDLAVGDGSLDLLAISVV